MTTGRRVARKRKELGLSQEALGEKLGVSRQSIYKWESDGALPEVEKLVALSRLFGVSVGWLLGVEEGPSTGEGELTEAQMKMVEELAARYAPKPQLSSGRLAAVKISVVAEAVCLCMILLGFYWKLEDLSRSYDRLQASIGQVQTDVDGQIGSISRRVEEILKAQNGVAAAYGTSLQRVNLAGNRAKFSVYAVPKTFVEGMRAEFYAGDRDQRVGTYGAGQSFDAELYCGLEETIVLSVDFVYPDETRQTQILDTYRGLYGRTFPAARADYALAFQEVRDGKIALEDDAWGFLDCDPSSMPDALSTVPAAEAEAVRVGLFKNKKLVEWAVFVPSPGVVEEETDVLTGEQWEAVDGLKQKDADGNRSRELLTFYFPAREVPVEAGDALQTAVVIRDVYGRTAVRAGTAFGLDEGWSELHPLEQDASDTCPDEWMLADGSPISSYIAP